MPQAKAQEGKQAAGGKIQQQRLPCRQPLQQTSRSEELDQHHQPVHDAPPREGNHQDEGRIKEKQARGGELLVGRRAFDMVMDGLFGAGIDAFGTFGTGDGGAALVDVFLAHGEGGADGDAFLALGALIEIHPQLKNIDFIGQRTECPHGAEASALGALLAEDGHHEHQADEDRKEGDGLEQGFKRSDPLVFGHGLEGAEPIAIGRCHLDGRRQSHKEQQGKGEPLPDAAQMVQDGFLQQA